MATCPNCGVSSRKDPGALVIEKVLVAKPIGTFSVPGSTIKFSSSERLRLRCDRCGWSVLGYIDGDQFIADPPAGTGY